MSAFIATEENWSELHGLFIQQVQEMSGKLTTEGFAVASELMGSLMSPPMTGEDFRKYDTAGLRRKAAELAAQLLTNKPSNVELFSAYLEGVRPGPKSVVDQELSMGARATMLLKRISANEMRFEVCLNDEMALNFQKALNKASEIAGLRKGSVRSHVMGEVVHQAGEKRVLVMVTRV